MWSQKKIIIFVSSILTFSFAFVVYGALKFSSKTYKEGMSFPFLGLNLDGLFEGKNSDGERCYKGFGVLILQERSIEKTYPIIVNAEIVGSSFITKVPLVTSSSHYMRPHPLKHPEQIETDFSLIQIQDRFLINVTTKFSPDYQFELLPSGTNLKLIQIIGYPTGHFNYVFRYRKKNYIISAVSMDSIFDGGNLFSDQIWFTMQMNNNINAVSGIFYVDSGALSRFENETMSLSPPPNINVPFSSNINLKDRLNRVLKMYDLKEVSVQHESGRIYRISGKAVSILFLYLYGVIDLNLSATENQAISEIARKNWRRYESKYDRMFRHLIPPLVLDGKICGK